MSYDTTCGRGNYLRVRGEYTHMTSVFHIGGALPPRARRIQVMYEDSPAVDGTTSACAENTLNELGLL